METTRRPVSQQGQEDLSLSLSKAASNIVDEKKDKERHKLDRGEPSPNILLKSALGDVFR